MASTMKSFKLYLLLARQWAKQLFCTAATPQ
jgi:hypothetical protein